MTRTPGLDAYDIDRLTKVPASTAIGDEASRFTPWLATHINLVSDVIGIDLAIGTGEDLSQDISDHTEVRVGDYRLDIRAQAADGAIVAIENQYGRSDHKHLGQVLTYASGVEADVVIWIAEGFTEPHLAALRWLNRRTDKDCGAYAIELSFLRIGDSAPAPSLTCLVRPSEEEREVRKATVTAGHWNHDGFLDAIADPKDRATAEVLMKRTVDGGGRIYFGKRPLGYVALHPLQDQPGTLGLCLSSKGQVQVSGLWKMWPSRQNDPGYTDIATFLGQSYDGPAARVPLAACEMEGLWRSAVSSAHALEAREADASA